MTYLARTRARRGAVLPLVAICMVALMGMLALAIDIGVVAVARCQAQNAADAAAMAGARTITGNTGQNISQVSVNAVMAATSNSILGKTISGSSTQIASPASDVFTSGQVSVQCGGFSYVYNDSNPAAEGFKLTIPGVPSGDPYSACQVTISATSPTSFGQVFGLNTFNVQATSAAVHRPRDVAIIMDMSGSMRLQSLPGAYVDASGTSWPNYPSFGRNTSLNADPVFPQFGHYSDTASAALQGNGNSYPTSIGVNVDSSNITATSNSGPPIVADFTSSGTTAAFTAASSAFATTPGGDNFPMAGGSYVATVNAYLNNPTNPSTLLNFASTYSGKIAANGYTQGPNYWGQTFFMWPPDPQGSALDPTNTSNHANNGAKDWRQRFFFKVNAATGQLGWLDHNNILINPAGQPMTGSNSVTPIMKTAQTQTTVNENGAPVTYTYAINYLAILNWLQSGAAPFPSQMTTGRIAYYSAMPSTSDTTLNSRWWTTYPLTDPNERFWKDYIDFVLGLRGNGAGTYINNNGTAGGSTVPLSAVIGNGDYYKWSGTTVQVSQKPNSVTGTVTGSYAIGFSGAISIAFNNGFAPAVNDYVWFNNGAQIYQVLASAGGTVTFTTALTAAIANGAAATTCYTPCTYMDPNDNPYRPRHQMWFGPMTFVDYLGNYSTNTFMWPGNVHEAQAWACKAGIQTAINDIQNNHPNDYVGLGYFSTPMFSAGDTVGRQNAPMVPLGRSYSQLTSALWFPPSTVTGTASTITPYSADFPNVPRAYGGTTPVMTFMMAYNMLSSSVTNLRTFAQPEPQYYGNAGGLGRKGAARLIIFETDGAPNAEAYTKIVSSGSDSYYPIRIVSPDTLSSTSNEFPTSGAWTWANGTQNVYTVVKQICAQTSATPPGFSTSSKPVQVYCIGYGSLFDPANASATQTNALTFLQTIQYYGNTSTNTSGSSFPASQLIYGTTTQRINNMQTAFTNIMQSGVQVSIIQ